MPTPMPGATQAADVDHVHSVDAIEDGRAVLELTSAERVMVLDEMRLLLNGVQKMTDTHGKQDMQATADAAAFRHRPYACVLNHPA